MYLSNFRRPILVHLAVVLLDLSGDEWPDGDPVIFRQLAWIKEGELCEFGRCITACGDFLPVLKSHTLAICRASQTYIDCLPG